MKKNYASSRFLWRQENRLRKMLLGISFIFLALTSFGQLGTIQIGSGNATTSGFETIPVTNYDYNYSQQIVTAAEYSAGGGVAGNITKIKYYVTNTATVTDWNDWTVYLGNTSKTSFSSQSDWEPFSSLTQVFSGIIVPVANNWFEITFTAPFNYTGGNLIVAVDENAPSYSSPQFRTYTSTSNSGLLIRMDGTNPDPTAPPTGNYLGANLPQLQFEGTLASCLPPSALTATSVTASSANLAWTGNSPSTDYDVEWGLAGFTPTGTPTSSVTTNSLPISSLTSSTSYQFYVRSVCSLTEESTWSGPFTFSTTQIPAVVPFTDDFSTNEWTLQNGSQVNQWFIGGAAGNPANGLYISNDNGVTHAYQSSSASSKVQAYRDIQFPATVTTFNLSFDWINNGESSYDRLRVWMVPTSATLVAGTDITTTNTPGALQLGGNFSVSNVWTANQNFVLPSSYAGTISRLVFEWVNDGSLGSQVPAAVDNVSVTAITCAAPTALAATNLTSSSADLVWTENGTATDWEIKYGVTGFDPTTATIIPVTDNPYLVSGLTPFTTYQFYVRTVCGPSNESVWAGPFSFTTTCEVADIPFFEGFETGYTNNNVVVGCWLQEIPSTVTWTKKWQASNSTTNTMRDPRTGGWNSTLGWNGNSWLFRGMNLTAGTQYLVKFYARQDGSTPANANIEASFGTAADAASMTDVVIVNTGLTNGPYQEFIGYYTPTTSGVYYLGIQGYINITPNYIALDDISVVVAPTCPAPVAITASNITPYSAELAWTESGTASDWEIQYGLAGFAINTGTIIETSLNPHEITGLQPASAYHFYVRTMCSTTDSSTWSGPYTVSTACAPITSLPWTENFDNLSAIGTGVFPLCWVDETPGDWSTTSAPFSSGMTAGPLSGSNYLRVQYYTDARVWTPEFELIAGETYEFSFSWAGDGDSGWEGTVYVNDSQVATGATQLGAKFIEIGDQTTTSYKKETYCFTPITSGVYTFGVNVEEVNFAWYMSFDDFKLKQVITVPGTDGSLTVCQTGALVDLNDVITTTVTDGTWNFDLNPNAVNSSGMFNAASVPSGTHDFFYITTGCAPDTTIATITIAQPSSAGSDGSIAVCRNQPFSLLSGLTGNADFGGVWTDPNGVVVPNGNTTSSNIPGQYNYKYIVTNGVCPADTAKVVVNVQGCDYLAGIDDVVFEGFNLYPNPTSDVIFISNTASTEVFNYEVLDMNGRVILKADKAINGSTTTELNLGTVETGVYLIRVFNEQAEKTFRVVKN